MKFIRFSDSIIPISSITEIESRDGPCGNVFKIYLGFNASDGPAILEEKYHELINEEFPSGDGRGVEERDSRLDELLELLNA